MATMLTAGIMAFSVKASYDLSKATSRFSKLNRVKIAMSSIEVKVHSLAYDPVSYLNCDSHDAGQCEINDNIFSNLRMIIPGSQCDPNNPPAFCGIDVQNVKIVRSNVPNVPDTFQAEIVYTGTDLSLRPLYVDIKLPSEILQQFQCCVLWDLFPGLCVPVSSILEFL